MFQVGISSPGVWTSAFEAIWVGLSFPSTDSPASPNRPAPAHRQALKPGGIRPSHIDQDIGDKRSEEFIEAWRLKEAEYLIPREAASVPLCVPRVFLLRQ